MELLTELFGPGLSFGPYFPGSGEVGGKVGIAGESVCERKHLHGEKTPDESELPLGISTEATRA